MKAINNNLILVQANLAGGARLILSRVTPGLDMVQAMDRVRFAAGPRGLGERKRFI